MIKITLNPVIEIEPPYVCEIEFTPFIEHEDQDCDFVAVHDFICAN